MKTWLANKSDFFFPTGSMHCMTCGDIGRPFLRNFRIRKASQTPSVYVRAETPSSLPLEKREKKRRRKERKVG